MWLIQRRRDMPVKLVAAQSGEMYTVGAYEDRQLPTCAPYGIQARPPQGEQAAILSADSGQVCLGNISIGWPEGLQPGEILLQSFGGASIKLCNDGKILLNGKEWKGEQ